MSFENIKKELQEQSNSEKEQIYKRFFKTGPGEYGEGDVFWGLSSQEIKYISRKYSELELNEIQKLLDSEIHECRMTGLRILIDRYRKNKKEIFDFYLSNTRNINNWDLVDVSCHKIVGDFLLDKDRSVLYELAQSDDLWEKRIAIVSTYAFIRKCEFKDTLKISEILLEDSHDLMHKAVGWMLREVGKKNEKVLEEFLQKNYDKIARTTLRYAIEKFEELKRKRYLKREF